MNIHIFQQRKRNEYPLKRNKWSGRAPTTKPPSGKAHGIHRQLQSLDGNHLLWELKDTKVLRFKNHRKTRHDPWITLSMWLLSKDTLNHSGWEAKSIKKDLMGKTMHSLGSHCADLFCFVLFWLNYLLSAQHSQTIFYSLMLQCCNKGYF